MARPRSVSELGPWQQLLFLSIAHADFVQCAIAAERAIATDSTADPSLYIALIEAAIVRYARPFTRCCVPQERARGAPQRPQLSAMLDKSYVPDQIQGALTVHRGAMEMRDSMYAHSDIELKPVRLMRLAHGDLPGSWRILGRVQGIGRTNLRYLHRLARALVERTSCDVADLAKIVLPPMQPGKHATLQFRREAKD